MHRWEEPILMIEILLVVRDTFCSHNTWSSQVKKHQTDLCVFACGFVIAVCIQQVRKQQTLFLFLACLLPLLSAPEVRSVNEGLHQLLPPNNKYWSTKAINTVIAGAPRFVGNYALWMLLNPPL